MKTLVIHLQDETTEELGLIYNGCTALGEIERVSTFIGDDALKSKIIAADMIIMLGHGAQFGLLDTTRESGRTFLIDSSFAPLFKGKNVIGFWCFAREFASMNNISGFFSSMWISEESEALMFNVPGFKQEYIRAECGKVANNIRQLLSEGVALKEFPDRLRAMCDQHNRLTDFNYSGLQYFS